jgi:guanine deaminase
MHELSAIAKKYDLPIQSHLSESAGEIAWVKELHPDQSNYSSVYDHFGLLTEKTVMAHCIHLDHNERKLLLDRKVGISHCPSSNFCLHSGVMNVRRLIEEGYEKIGLGTDCAGGYSPSILDAMRQALIASKVIHIDTHNAPDAEKLYKALNFANVFYLATLGGARCMALDDKIGNFQVSKQFDAIVVDVSHKQHSRPLLHHPDREPAAGNMDIFPHDDHMSVFEKFIYLSDDRSLKSVYVAGNRVL